MAVGPDPILGDPRGIGSYPSLADVTMLREPPATARGARTRAGIVAAARKMFEEKGFPDSRLADIYAAAGCSTGTFYLYFSSKEEVLQAVLDTVRDDMLHPGIGDHVAPSDSRAVIAASIRGYLQAFRRNASMMRLLEQVTTIDPAFRARRILRSRAFAERNARGIADLQERGLADPELDPYLTACALSSMVSRMAYHTYCMTSVDGSVLSTGEPSVDELTDICTTLWVRGLGLNS
jgi:AcrR family transcriptional regulator